MLNPPISIKNAPHFIWNDKCDRWWLKKDGHFNVISEIMLPKTTERKHFHKIIEQFFYCLEGVLTIESEGKECMLLAQEGCIIAPGIPHKARNNSNEVVQFLVIFLPKFLRRSS